MNPNVILDLIIFKKYTKFKKDSKTVKDSYIKNYTKKIKLL